ncbi:11995_t:CDS:2 [Gigaspora margarita]|uniref:11995_t:CDS:1 n=1 Tax=Gigaspora margarita TaxID=4874 RepID=A0ABN7UJP7_GIGMA|nr:11995_t:CDS:2 [Gigaspora margarita]
MRHILVPQLNKPRANAVLACTSCRKSHRRKRGPRSKSSNFLYETATEEFQPSYSNLEPLLTTEAFIVQEPSPNNQNTMLIDSYETTNEEFQSPYLNFGIPHIYNPITTISSHIYNHITITPSFRTDEVFIGQRLMSDNQNTTSINSYEITAFINRALIPNTASLNPYEITIEEFKSSFSNFGSPYIYNHITVIPPFEATETFFGQGPMLYQNTTPISPCEITTEEFQFPTAEAFIDPYETINQSSYSNFRTPQIYNHITAIPLFEATEMFIGQGPMLDQNSASVNSTYEITIEDSILYY